jgi:hypothetical protein
VFWGDDKSTFITIFNGFPPWDFNHTDQSLPACGTIIVVLGSVGLDPHNNNRGV